jgi:hypothetical protein
MVLQEHNRDLAWKTGRQFLQNTETRSAGEAEEKMIIADDLLFGRIAITQKSITEENLRECLDLQRSTLTHLSIGKILLKKEYITTEEIENVLDIQEQNLREASGYSPRRKLKETLFGTLAVKSKRMPLPIVLECLHEQEHLERLNIFLRLGEIFISKGYMDVKQVRSLLDQQKGEAGKCIICGKPVEKPSHSPVEGQICKKCKKKVQRNDDFSFKDL